MLVAVTTVRIKKGKTARFGEILEEIAAKSQTLEPGCLSYQGFRHQADPHIFVVVEQYRDRAALADHGDTAHFKAATAEFADLVDGKPETVLCDRLC